MSMVSDPFGMSPFGAMFTILPILVAVVFIVVIGTFVVTGIKGASRWRKNNDSPVLTVNAQVVTKRGDVSHHHNSDGFDRSSTTYYVTFQVESGDRMEFLLSGEEYGLLVEGDEGKLTFQGTRYQGFARQEG